MYFIGTTEKEIVSTLKELKALNKELNLQGQPRSISEPNTPRIKCRKIKTISRRIRDKREERKRYTL